MERTESMDSLDYCFPSNNCKESAVFALACWQNVYLSDIWIPANLLSTKEKSSNSQQINHDIYHTLQKEEDVKCIESFSVYYDSEEQQEEIFQSDSDEEILFSSGCNSCEEYINNITLLAKNKSSEADVSSCHLNYSEKNTTDYILYENVGSSKIKHLKSNENVNSCETEYFKSNENVSKNNLSIRTKTSSCNLYENEENNSTKSTSNQSVNEVQTLTDSQISLNEILDKTPDINLQQFSFEFKKDTVGLTVKSDRKTELNMKRMNKKERQLKKKASKKIALDELPQHEVYEDDCANPFYKSIMRQKVLATYTAEERNNIEFPKLVVEEDKLLISESGIFIKSDKPHNEKNSVIGLQSVIDSVLKTTNTEKEDIKIESEVVMPLEDEKKPVLGKMVIENIPFDVSEDSIYDILLGYGEIKNFTLKPDGKFLKAFVEMDLICNIDWIIDCLNGTDPFGASSETLKCYNVTDSCN